MSLLHKYVINKLSSLAANYIAEKKAHNAEEAEKHFTEYLKGKPTSAEGEHTFLYEDIQGTYRIDKGQLLFGNEVTLWNADYRNTAGEHFETIELNTDDVPESNANYIIFASSYMPA